MIAVIKNDIRRLLHQGFRYWMMVILMIGIIGLAFYMNEHTKETLRVAFVGEKQEMLVKNEQLDVDFVSKQPPVSALVTGQYQLIIKPQTNSFLVESLDGKKEASNLKEAFELKKTLKIQKTGKTSRIIGYLMMFLFLSNLTNLSVLTEDKERRLFAKIATTNTSYTKVIAGHAAFSIFFVLLPVMISLYSWEFLFGTSIGVSFWECFLLMLGLCLIATSLSMLFISLFRTSDQANMSASLFFILTTLLSGSFISFENGNKWLDRLIQLLPQKSYLTIVHQLEGSGSTEIILKNSIYLTGIVLAAGAFAIWQIRREVFER